MTDNKLSELRKPVAWSDERRNICTNTIKERGLNSEYRQDYEKYSTPLYSQEYVYVLLAELEAKDKRIAELSRLLAHNNERAEAAEAKLATPVRLPPSPEYRHNDRMEVRAEKDGYISGVSESAAALREQGLTVEGEE